MVSGRKRRGTLTPEDRALWDAVKKSVAPLRPEPKRIDEPDVTSTPAEADRIVPAKAHRKTAVGKTPKPAPAVKQSGPSDSVLDRRTRKRLAKGTIAIDARIDLHGMTQRQAFMHLKGFFSASQQRGFRHVLVITGKGIAGDARGVGEGFAERGILKRVVPHWLNQPEFRIFVAGYEEAHTAHGGGGAFYVRLRKQNSVRSR